MIIRVGIDYYTIFYLELDKLVSTSYICNYPWALSWIILQLFGEIISHLELRSKEKDPIMYELYVIFKDMAKLTEKMQLNER